MEAKVKRNYTLSEQQWLRYYLMAAAKEGGRDKKKKKEQLSHVESQWIFYCSGVQKVCLKI